ncbi:hypothetical protein O3G_MSEX014279 [Manduca sexta]|uniref:Uncharacterized protein n=1 Tax=Manduca sexta TaxID=7130 RepID=A0A921ZVB1_MANSE|nr:hypothetical protein O3G_MSEX014279 [Manduca sexta]
MLDPVPGELRHQLRRPQWLRHGHRQVHRGGHCACQPERTARRRQRARGDAVHLAMLQPRDTSTQVERAT